MRGCKRGRSRDLGKNAVVKVQSIVCPLFGLGLPGQPWYNNGMDKM